MVSIRAYWLVAQCAWILHLDHTVLPATKHEPYPSVLPSYWLVLIAHIRGGMAWLS